VVLSPIRPVAVRTPLLRLPADDLCWAFNLIRLPASADSGEARRLVKANEAAYTRIRDAGGTLYPASAFDLPPSGWREHFGPLFARLQSARERFDPGGILTPGYGVF
jgi:FAD/FMN-containing dehydrogenase